MTCIAGSARLDWKTVGPGCGWSGTGSRIWLRGQVLDMALEQPELSPRELAAIFTDTKAQFISEASVYRLLKAAGLITSPAYIVMKGADEFRDKTTAPNQL
jgi:hypothetical protein